MDWNWFSVKVRFKFTATPRKCRWLPDKACNWFLLNIDKYLQIWDEKIARIRQLNFVIKFNCTTIFLLKKEREGKKEEGAQSKSSSSSFSGVFTLVLISKDELSLKLELSGSQHSLIDISSFGALVILTIVVSLDTFTTQSLSSPTMFCEMSNPISVANLDISILSWKKQHEDASPSSKPSDAFLMGVAHFLAPILVQHVPGLDGHLSHQCSSFPCASNSCWQSSS